MRHDNEELLEELEEEFEELREEGILLDEEETALLDEDEEEEGEDLDDEGEMGDTKAIVKPNKPAAPPVPDLRFEESYLRAISAAKGNWWKIAFITARDQIFMPLVQGTIWSFLLLSAATLRTNSSNNGRYFGSGLVRWWQSINPPRKESF